MTVPYRKKLIEVSLPLEAINKASAKEQSIRCGHPNMLHLWWARRPLAACRASCSKEKDVHCNASRSKGEYTGCGWAPSAGSRS